MSGILFQKMRRSIEIQPEAKMQPSRRGVLCAAAFSPLLGLCFLTNTGIAGEPGSEGQPSTFLIPLTLTPYGFEPTEMNLRPTRVVLAVYNRTGLKELSLRIDRDTPGNPRERIAQERVPSSRWKWGKQLVLAPGTYIVSEERHPEWVCRIKVSMD